MSQTARAELRAPNCCLHTHTYTCHTVPKVTRLDVTFEFFHRSVAAIIYDLMLSDQRTRFHSQVPPPQPLLRRDARTVTAAHRPKPPETARNRPKTARV